MIYELSCYSFLVLCTYKPETLTVRAGINLPKANPGDVLQHTKPNVGSVEPYGQDMDYNELQPARLEAQKEETEQSSYGKLHFTEYLIVVRRIMIFNKYLDFRCDWRSIFGYVLSGCSIRRNCFLDLENGTSSGT